MIAGMILAGGTSSRLGRPKQLLPLAGRPLLRHVLEAALASPLDEVVMVLGYRASEVASAAPPVGSRVRYVVNERFAEGQSTSLSAGLRTLGPEFEAAVVLLGDQPGIAPEAIGAVIDAFRRERPEVVQATYGGRPGHPTLLARGIWEHVIRDASGDQGAGPVIAAHPEWVRRIEVGGPLPEDVDTETDYERLRAQFEEPSH